MAAGDNSFQVCIIGDGAVGKAAALGLAQLGLRVALLGQSEGPKVGQTVGPAAGQRRVSEDDWDARVFALNHCARALLDGVKVWSAMDASRINSVSAMHVTEFDLQTREVPKDAAVLQFDAYSAQVNELAWIVEEQNLRWALDAALQFAQNVVRVPGVAQALEFKADGVRVRCARGEEICAELVVGADGAFSWVRAQCELALDYRSYDQQGVVCNFSCERPHRGVAYQWFVGAQGVIALLPLSGNRVSLVWSAPDTLAKELMAQSAEQLAARLFELSDEKLGRLSPLPSSSVRAFPLRLMRSPQMVSDRLALVGDAAHVVHPLAGHGMNLGFGDVQALMTCLAERGVHRDCGDRRVLNRYQRSRREEVDLMQWTTDGLSRLFANDLPAVRLVRRLGLNFLNQVPVLKRTLIAHAIGR